MSLYLQIQSLYLKFTARCFCATDGLFGELSMQAERDKIKKFLFFLPVFAQKFLSNGIYIFLII